MFPVSLSFFCSYYFPVILLAEEDILIRNQAAQEELCSYGSYINLQEDKPQASLERPETFWPALTSGEHLSMELETIYPEPAPGGNLPEVIHAVYYTKCKGALHFTISPGPALRGNLPTNTSTLSIIQNVRVPSTCKAKVPTKKRK
ncbi:hypothetical protein SLEP1_g8274 [Rubroshorea leprosula]|uniref:Uncharacterized protein n=1 Tax=Rubroshorea leprosula TaxID=152421 RepID=A0AAV5IC60_9ROSI|nr:hypothetical protein SLEP1_g8274 [Rubroshorea leprosula]